MRRCRRVTRSCPVDASFCRTKCEPALALDPSHGPILPARLGPSRTTVRRPARSNIVLCGEICCICNIFCHTRVCAGPSACRAAPVLDRMPPFWKLAFRTPEAESGVCSLLWGEVDDIRPALRPAVPRCSASLFIAYCGRILARQPVQYGDRSSPTVSDSAVFVSYACNQTYAEFGAGKIRRR